MNSLFNKVADLRPVRLTSFWLFFSFLISFQLFFRLKSEYIVFKLLLIILSKQVCFIMIKIMFFMFQPGELNGAVCAFWNSSRFV